MYVSVADPGERRWSGEGGERGGGGGAGGGGDEEPMKRGWENKKGTVVLFPGRS